MPSDVLPDVVGYRIGPIAEPRDGLSKRQCGAFRTAEVRCIAPGGHCEEALVGFALLFQVARMHVHTYTAAIDLARSQFDEGKRSRRHAALLCRRLQTMQGVHGLRNKRHYVFDTRLHKNLLSSFSR